jgi:hypothetical protein
MDLSGVIQMMTVDGDYRKMKEVLTDIVKESRKAGESMTRNEDSPVYRVRETIIRLIVEQLRKDAVSLKEHRPVSALCQFCPSIRAIREKDKLLEETAQRIAWQLYDDCFAAQMKWASTDKGDPFYKDSRRYLLTDSEMSAIDVYRSIAERKYKNLLQNLRAEFSCQNIGVMGVSSAPTPTLTPTPLSYAHPYSASASSHVSIPVTPFTTLL